MDRKQEILNLRDVLRKAVAIADGLLLAESGGLGLPGSEAASAFRRRPGGPLTEAGVAEVQRRLEAGQTDSQIALAMEISLTGISKRRWMWRKERKQ